MLTACSGNGSGSPPGRFWRKWDVVRLDELRCKWFVEHVGRGGGHERNGHGGHDGTHVELVGDVIGRLGWDGRHVWRRWSRGGRGRSRRLRWKQHESDRPIRPDSRRCPTVAARSCRSSNTKQRPARSSAAPSSAPREPSDSTNDIAAEASGRRAVRLAATSAYVEIKNLSPSNSIVVRYSIPDRGLDYSATLSLYVDGKFRQKLKVTSRYSWSYGGANDFANTAIEKNPASGTPHHFFDETRALVADIPVGSMVRLQKDGDDTAANYDIDFIDMEQVPAAFGPPAGFLSVTDFGAIPNDGLDDTAAFQACAGRTRNLYIPEGTFDIKTKEISVQGITVRGAGMWRSVVNGPFARFDCYSAGCKFYDFSITGDTTLRDDRAPETAFTGNGMSGSLIEHVWVEHKKLGVWPGNNTSGLTIRNSRFRDLFADGINLPCGTSNSLVEHTHIRNSGDDAFAVWSLNTCGANTNNTFRHVYAQLPWRANCFGLYGGSTTIQDSVCADVVQYPGILIARQFDSNAFGTTNVTGVTFTRAGGPMFAQQGALKLSSDQGPVQNIQISNVDIDSSTFSGIHLAGRNTIDTVSFTGINVTSPGGCGILAQTTGAADATNVVVTGAGSGLCNERAFNFIKHAGNVGW